MREAGFNVRLLSAGPFVTMIDRFAVAPVLIPIAVEFRTPVGAVAIAATAYYFVYGLAQPFWGFASDRAGRIRIIRISLAATAAACALTALAPNLDFLIGARILAGASVCAVIPSALVYIGDTIPFKTRQAVIADVLAAVAIGTAAGSLGGGFLAHYLSWRLIFGVAAVLAAVLAVAMARLPESNVRPSTGGPIAQLRQAFRRPWARFLILFAIPEGAMVLGFLVYFAPALEATGTNAALAGLVVATYGGAVLAGTRVIKRFASAPRPGSRSASAARWGVPGTWPRAWISTRSPSSWPASSSAAATRSSTRRCRPGRPKSRPRCAARRRRCSSPGRSRAGRSGLGWAPSSPRRTSTGLYFSLRRLSACRS